MAFTRLPVLALVFVAYSVSSEVEHLDPSDPSVIRLCEGADSGCPEGDAAKALSKAIADGGKGDTITGAKEAIMGVQSQTQSSIAAAEKQDARLTQLKALADQKQKAKRAAQREKRAADKIAKAAKAEVDEARVQARVNRVEANAAQKAQNEELIKARVREKKAIDGALSKSLAAAESSFNVANTNALAASANLAKAQKEVSDAAAATEKVNAVAASTVQASVVHKLAPPEVKLTAAMWATKVRATKKAAFEAHLTSAKRAQTDLEAFKAVNMFEAQLNKAKSALSREESDVATKEDVEATARQMRFEADANAKYSTSEAPVKEQLAQNAASEDLTEATASMKLSAAKVKLASLRRAVAVLEHSGELRHLETTQREADKQTKVADLLARNAEKDSNSAEQQLQVAVKEQTLEDASAKIESELRHKKAVTAHELAKLRHIKADSLANEAKAKFDEAKLAKETREAAVAAAQKAEKKADTAAKKAEAARVAEVSVSKRAAQEEAHKSEKKATPDTHSTSAVQLVASDACKQCKAKCQSETCTSWCGKHWCSAGAQDAAAHAKMAPDAAELREEKAIDVAIEHGGDAQDTEKAKELAKIA